MKTMTKAEFKNFVMSGYFPTSNEDIADLQDVYGYLPYWYHISLVVCEETRDKMCDFCEKLLHPKDYEKLMDTANEKIREIEKAKAMREKIAEMEKEIKALDRSTSTVRAFLNQIEVEVFD